MAWEMPATSRHLKRLELNIVLAVVVAVGGLIHVISIDFYPSSTYTYGDLIYVAQDAQTNKSAVPVSNGKTTGFVVLGMHRSGTSMLSGLLVTGGGYNVGGPLLKPQDDNEKGFFELIDVVRQNDQFMARQKIKWYTDVVKYDTEKALAYKGIESDYKKKALQFLNNPKNSPWILKDPRMCITLKTWLHLLDAQPAAVFTYRHPLEVAMSLKKREKAKNMTLEHGLRLWLLYNMRAIQNSANLCRVFSSNDMILAHPLSEVQRISAELTHKCGVPEPPRNITQKEVDMFVDAALQHNKDKREEDEKTRGILAEYDGCTIREYQSDLIAGTIEAQSETELYMQAMKVYCDLENGKAYENSYVWPELR